LFTLSKQAHEERGLLDELRQNTQARNNSDEWIYQANGLGRKGKEWLHT
jgi:hypothetical protein